MLIAEQTAQHLLKINAVKLAPNAPFTWASGILSPIYCDNRVALSHPETRNYIKKALAVKSQEFDAFDAVVGVATAGIPHGTLLADAIEQPFLYVRSSAKAHGRQNLIEGDTKGIQKVLVIEDLISTGGSVLKAVDALEEAGLEVVGVLAIFTYGFPKAKAAFDARNIPFSTLSNYEKLLEAAVPMGYVNEDDLATLKRWRENPDKWGALYA